MENKTDPIYQSKVYKALKENIEGFDKTEQEFKTALKDKNYQKNVYKALKDNLDGFNKEENEFYSLVTDTKPTPQKKNSNQSGVSNLDGGSSDLSGDKMQTFSGFSEQDVATIQDNKPKPKIDKTIAKQVNPIGTEINKLRDKLKDVKVTPSNQKEVTDDTNKLNKLLQKNTPQQLEIKRQEDLKKEPDFLQKYENFIKSTSTVTDEDITRAKEELKSEEDNYEWTDYLREGAKGALNNVIKFANTPMTAINKYANGNLPEIPLIDKKQPLEKNLKQADDYFLELKKEAKTNKKPIPNFTNEDRIEKAREFYIKEKTDSYVYSRQKDYLQEQDDVDGGVLQSKFADFKKGDLASLNQKEQTILNKQAVQIGVYNRLQTEIENIQKQTEKQGN